MVAIWCFKHSSLSTSLITWYFVPATIYICRSLGWNAQNTIILFCDMSTAYNIQHSEGIGNIDKNDACSKALRDSTTNKWRWKGPAVHEDILDLTPSDMCLETVLIDPPHTARKTHYPCWSGATHEPGAYLEPASSWSVYPEVGGMKRLYEGRQYVGRGSVWL